MRSRLPSLVTGLIRGSPVPLCNVDPPTALHRLEWREKEASNPASGTTTNHGVCSFICQNFVLTFTVDQILPKSIKDFYGEYFFGFKWFFSRPRCSSNFAPSCLRKPNVICEIHICDIDFTKKAVTPFTVHLHSTQYTVHCTQYTTDNFVESCEFIL